MYGLLHAFVKRSGISADEAYARLFVEERMEQQRIKRTPDLAARVVTAY